MQWTQEQQPIIHSTADKSYKRASLDQALPPRTRSRITQSHSHQTRRELLSLRSYFFGKICTHISVILCSAMTWGGARNTFQMQC